MKRRELTVKYLLLIITCLSLCNCSCSRDGTPNQRLSKRHHYVSVAMSTEPGTLDCRQAQNLDEMTLCGLIYEGLYHRGPDGNPELGLARKVKVSEDGRIYTIKLRHSEWSNGDPVTAYDFEQSWKQVLHPSFPAPMANLLYVIDNAKPAKEGLVAIDEVGVKALNSHTLVIKLRHSVPYFPELLSNPVFSAVNQRLLARNPKAYSQQVVGNGPFSLRRWRPGYEVQLAKNSHYWDKESPSMGNSILRFVVIDETTALGLYERGELSWAGSPLSVIPTEALPELKEADALRTEQVAGTEWIRVNTTQGPLTHASFRKALSQGIDREALTEHILLGGQQEAFGIVPPSVGPGLKLPAVEQARAKELLEKALSDLDLSLEALPPITLSYSNSPRRHQIAQVLQQQWEALGLHINLERAENQLLLSKLRSLDYDLALGSWFGDYNDASNFLEVFQDSQTPSNKTGWENPVYTLLLERARQETDTDQRCMVMEQAERVLLREQPVIPLFYYTLNYVQDGSIANVQVTETGRMEFRHAVVD